MVGRLFFNMGLLIPARRRLYIETGPRGHFSNVLEKGVFWLGGVKTGVFMLGIAADIGVQTLSFLKKGLRGMDTYFKTAEEIAADGHRTQNAPIDDLLYLALIFAIMYILLCYFICR